MISGVSENLLRLENDEAPHQQPKRGWGWGQWVLIGVLAALVVGLSIPAFKRVSEKACQPQAVSNCRQIIITLKWYAGDHGGSYPDGVTANDAFRELIKGGWLEDERVFSSPVSLYVGDNIVGKAPEYADALQARENHWAMTKGLTDASDSDCPAVFENPAAKSWPPRWDSRFIEVTKPGRVWKGGKIVVGRNDGSVNVEKLARDGSPLVTLEPIKDGKNLFELAGPHTILDVAR